MSGETKVTVIENVVHVATIGMQGPPGAGGAGIEYVDAGDTASRARVNHTGTQLASTISDRQSHVALRPWACMSAAKRAGGSANRDRRNGDSTGRSRT